ncbi:hypothetical protein Pfra02_04450 [Pseudomonas fragi]|nr:hypothetical protein Pfra02_04450 [Pseudomonas fragi]
MPNTSTAASNVITLELADHQFADLSAVGGCADTSSHMTPAEVITHNLRSAATACGQLRELQLGRASGALSALINMGLIDTGAYFAARKALCELDRKSLQKLRA